MRALDRALDSIDKIKRIFFFTADSTEEYLID